VVDKSAQRVRGHGSGSPASRGWRVLLAHDATASACDLLIDTIEGALGKVDVRESSSVDDARVALDTACFDLVMVCLDLPPAPRGGIRLAQELVGESLPVILVTRSLWWIPQPAAALRALPWIPPDAAIAQVSRAVGEAMTAGR
jgi:hypothetical protein